MQRCCKRKVACQPNAIEPSDATLLGAVARQLYQAEMG